MDYGEMGENSRSIGKMSLSANIWGVFHWGCLVGNEGFFKGRVQYLHSQ